MFSTPEAPAQGISAVKSLAIASAQGQKIWTITQNNLETAMAALQLDADSETEIRAGVLAGNVVTAHEKPINFNGWVGEGYTIIDPQTGAGAYKIAGGGNGAYLFGLHTATLIHLSFIFISGMSVTGPMGAAAVMLLIAMLTPILLIYAHNIKQFLGDDEQAISCYIGGLGAGLGAWGLLAVFNGNIKIKNKILDAMAIGLGGHIHGDSSPKDCF